MGLKEKSVANYVKIKDGKFYLSSDKEHTTPYGELEGVITQIGLRNDEYEGQTIEKLSLTINDGDDDYVVSFAFNSSYTSSLIGFLKNADLTKPLSLVPTQRTDKDGTTKRSILVKQGGSFLKQYYTKEHPNGLPRIEPVMVKGKQLVQNGRLVWDKEEFLQFYRDVVKNELGAQVGTATAATTAGPVNRTFAPEARTPVAMNNAEEDEVEDDLPF